MWFGRPGGHRSSWLQEGDADTSFKTEAGPELSINLAVRPAGFQTLAASHSPKIPITEGSSGLKSATPEGEMKR